MCYVKNQIEKLLFTARKPVRPDRLFLYLLCKFLSYVLANLSFAHNMYYQKVLFHLTTVFEMGTGVTKIIE